MSDQLYMQVLQHALQGGGGTRRRNSRQKASRKRSVLSKPRLRGAGAAPVVPTVDVDLVIQHFNHTGGLDHMQIEQRNADHWTTKLITPVVRNIVEAQLPHAEGHQLTDLLRHNGHKVPGSLNEAKQQLQTFAENAQAVRKGWDVGVYNTVETLLSATHNPSMVMELFACVASMMDSFSQLSAEDIRLVLPALLACAAALQSERKQRAVERWKTQPYAPHHISEINQIKNEIKAIKSSQTNAMRGGGVQSPVDISRHLLALHTTLGHKSQMVEAYNEIVGNTAVSQNSSAPPTSLSSSILAGPFNTPPPSLSNTMAPTFASQPTDASTSAGSSETVAGRAHAKAEQQAQDHRALEQKVDQLYASGGTPRRQMKQPTVVARNMGGDGVHLYAYLSEGKLHVDFMLEELKGVQQTPELRKRAEFLAKHKDRVSQAVSGELKEKERRSFAIEIAKSTDDKLANALHKFFE